MYYRLIQLLRKEFIQVFHDPRMYVIIFLIPVFETIVFGYAVTADVKHVSVAVCDLDNSALSRELVDQFCQSRYFDYTSRVSDSRKAREALDCGKTQVVLLVNHGLQNDLIAGRTASIQLLVDGSDSNTGGIILQYASNITRIFSDNHQSLSNIRARPDTARQIVELQPRTWFNENREGRNFYIPGVIALLVSMLALLLPSMSIVREKEEGTMEQLMVTPVRQLEFILGKTLPFAFLAYANLGLNGVLGVFWFEIPIRGSLCLLVCVTAVYIVSMISVGLLISTISTTQQQAMMTTFLVFYPGVLLSGFVFPISNMPVVVQWITLLNPIRHFLTVVRGIFLKGSGVSTLWPQVAILFLMASFLFTLAIVRFKKTAV